MTDGCWSNLCGPCVDSPAWDFCRGLVSRPQSQMGGNGLFVKAASTLKPPGCVGQGWGAREKVGSALNGTLDVRSLAQWGMSEEWGVTRCVGERVHKASHGVPVVRDPVDMGCGMD